MTNENLELVFDKGVHAVSEINLSPFELATCSTLSGRFLENPAAARIIDEIESLFGISLDNARISTHQAAIPLSRFESKWKYLGALEDGRGNYDWRQNCAKIHFAYHIGFYAPYRWVKGSYQLTANADELDEVVSRVAKAEWQILPKSETLYVFTDLTPIKFHESMPHWRFMATLFPQ